MCVLTFLSHLLSQNLLHKQTLEMLGKRENLLQKKMQQELLKAKEFNSKGNKRAALQCLKRKKLYEQQAENLANHQLKLEEQVIMLEVRRRRRWQVVQV